MIGSDPPAYEGSPYVGDHLAMGYSLIRMGQGCQDTNNSAVDFQFDLVSPFNSASPGVSFPVRRQFPRRLTDGLTSVRNAGRAAMIRQNTHGIRTRVARS